MKCKECKWSKDYTRNKCECHKGSLQCRTGLDYLIPIWPLVQIDDFCSDFEPRRNENE